jgi:hypothetical protein
MKGSWCGVGAACVAVVAMLLVAGCNDYGRTFQGNTGGTLISLSPPRISAGSLVDITLTINGFGFVKQTVVQWNGTPLDTKVGTNSAGAVTSVTATVPKAFVASPGKATVIAVNPATGAGNNGLSNPLAFIIDPAANPIPAIATISPSCAAAGSAALTLTVTAAAPTPSTNTSFVVGTDPASTSQIYWTVGGTQTTLPATGTTTTSQIQGTVSAGLLMTAGTASVTVFNPPSAGGGGGSSNAKTFTIPCTAATAAAKAAVGAGTVVEETPTVSLDGRYVAYAAMQNQMGQTGEHAQVFVHDTCGGASADCRPRTVVISVAVDGSSADGDSGSASMSSDGRYVAFSSAATNLVANAPQGRQIYLRDTCFGTVAGVGAGAGAGCTPSTQLISVDASGALAGTESILPSVSASGRFVAFLAVTPSHAPAGSAGGVNSGYRQVFVRDTCLGAANCTPKTTRISLQPNDTSDTKTAGPAISGNGKDVAMVGASTATLFTRAVAVDDRIFLAVIKDLK